MFNNVGYFKLFISNPNLPVRHLTTTNKELHISPPWGIDGVMPDCLKM